MKNWYEVHVGNLGLVHSGSAIRAARKAFNEYKRQSRSGYGRAAGERVTLRSNGWLIDEHEQRSQASEL